jgi:hypothetical protein
LVERLRKDILGEEVMVGVGVYVGVAKVIDGLMNVFIVHDYSHIKEGGSAA